MRADAPGWMLVSGVAEAMLVLCLLACTGAPAAAQEPPGGAGSKALPPWMLPFGDEHDPARPVAPDPQPAGKGIVAASLVTAGAAQVLEYEGEARDLAVAVMDVRIEAGSTTPDFDASSARGRSAAPAQRGGDAPLLGLCVVSKDASVTMTVATGTRRMGWTVHVNDQEFVCADASTRLAVLMPGGSFRLTAGKEADAGARIVAVFAVEAGELSAIELPGATLKLPPKATP